MKSKVIVRIVIWSLVIVLLTAVLAFFLGQETHFFRDLIIASSPLGVEEPQPTVSEDIIHYNKVQTEPITVTVLEELNLRATPSPQAESLTMLAPGTVLEVLRRENIGGELWGYVAEPDTGWIQMQYVETDASSTASDATAPAVTGAAEAQEYIGATVLENMNMRQKPSPLAETVAMLPAGTRLEILKTETVDGKLWGYVESPAPGGWIVMEYVKTDSSLPETENHAEALPSSGYPENVTPLWIPANEVRDIGIDWATGNITIYLVEDGEDILFYEEGGNPDRPMNSTHREGKLSIEFCDEKFFGIGIGSNLSKNLTIQIPKGTTLKELEIDAASAKVHVKDLTIQEINLDTASGTADFVNCTVDTMDVDTASGNIHFTGTLNALDCDAASADFEAILTNVPRSMEMDSASGSLKLTLPQNAGFSVGIEGLSSKLVSDFETTFQNDRFIHGDGACRIDMEAMSGKVTIHKGQ